uniref:Ig-like domain-containing protein n=1 Tax=Denticeps clupeoides TaxID=299321 RepID=A0AAY3ZTZ2_9TELE
TERKKAIVTLKPKWTKLFKGDSVLLRCDVEGEVSSDWEYIWYKDEEELHPYKSWSENSEYHIGPADEAHSGDYACVGMRKTDSVFSHMSDTITLTVSGEPKAVLIRRPNWAQVFGGENVIFRCDIQGELPSDWKYTWRKDGQKVNSEQEYRISPANESHSGDYTCRGTRKSDSQNSRTSEAISLSVLALPTPAVTVAPQSPVYTGETITLKCVLEISSGWSFKWFKGSSQNALPPSDHYSRAGDTLTILGASESDQDEYWCQGYIWNMSISSFISQSLNLTITSESLSTFILLDHILSFMFSEVMSCFILETCLEKCHKMFNNLDLHQIHFKLIKAH